MNFLNNLYHTSVSSYVHTEHEVNNRHLLRNLQWFPIAYKEGAGGERTYFFPRNCSAVSLGYQHGLSSVGDTPAPVLPVVAS